MLAVTIGLCALLVATALTVGLSAVAARHRARTGADLAALAAAAMVIEGRSDACRRAAETARANDVAMADCQVSGWRVMVRVTAPLPRPLTRFGSPEATAWAGPARTPTAPAPIMPNRTRS